jgi:hypothetical protein
MLAATDSRSGLVLDFAGEDAENARFFARNPREFL